MTSLSFDISVLEILWSLARGFTVVVLSDQQRDGLGSAASIPALIERYGVTHLQCTPSMAGMLLLDRRAVAALGRLDAMLVGGEALPTTLARQLRNAVKGLLLNMYGPTETTVWSTVQAVKETDGAIPIGRPIANTRLYILDDRQRVVPMGSPANCTSVETA